VWENRSVVVTTEKKMDDRVAGVRRRTLDT